MSGAAPADRWHTIRHDPSWHQTRRGRHWIGCDCGDVTPECESKFDAEVEHEIHRVTELASRDVTTEERQMFRDDRKIRRCTCGAQRDNAHPKWCLFCITRFAKAS
jgi:hypothetical protein